jgi:hypothetical protein
MEEIHDPKIEPLRDEINDFKYLIKDKEHIMSKKENS